MLRPSLVLALVIALSPPPARAALENKWRLQFSGNAESAGTIVVALDPWGRRPPVRVEVEIAAGTTENGVARAVRDALRAAAGRDYDIEVDDGEDVLVNRRLFRRRFEVRIEANDVRGVRINRDQE